MVDQSSISDFGVIWAQLSLQFPDANLVSEHLYMGNHLHYLYHHCWLAPLCLPYWEYAGELPISVTFILQDVFFLGSCYFCIVTVMYVPSLDRLVRGKKRLPTGGSHPHVADRAP